MLKRKLITQENAKFHCQTCLMKLDIKSDSSFTVSEEVPVNAKDRIYFVNIKANKEFQEFMATNIDTRDNTLLHSQQYPTHICSNCFRKWENLEKFCRKVQQSAKMLQSLFQNKNLKLENKNVAHDGIVNKPITRSSEKCKQHETFTNNDDALLETETITFLDSKNLGDIEKLDISIPDPFSESDHVLECISTKDELKEEDEETDVDFNNELEGYESDQDYIPTRKQTISPSQKQQPKKRGPKNVSGIIRKRVAAYRCDKCKRRFARQFHYEAHMLKVHEGSTHPYKCEECGKFYKAISALKYHMYVSHELGTKRFPCDDCGKEYKTEQSLRTHRLAQHLGQKRSKRFVCELCGAAFINQQTLTIHNNAKHSSKDGDDCSTEYKCQNCDKLFQSPYTLKYHILRNHTQDKHFKCDVCGAGFAKKFMVFAHMRTHTSNSERYPCPQCEKRFLSKSDAKKHMAAVHLKIKPYLCVYCGEAFGTPKTLRHHVYIHTGEKPYVCDVCGQGFRQPTSMKTHRNTHFKKLMADTNTTPIIN